MKTIKEHLKEYEKNWRELPKGHRIGYKSGFEVGFNQFKKDVLGAIDELRKKRGDTIELMELKARIKGK